MQAGRTPEKCVLFENLFLGALLAFLSQFVREGKKKTRREHFILKLPSGPEMLREGRKEGKKKGQREGQELNNRMCSHNLD